MKKLFSLLLSIILYHNHLIYSGQEFSPDHTVTIINQALQEQVEYVHVYFTALSGNFHDIILPIKKLESALEHGLKYDGSSIPGCSNIFESDMHLKLDHSTFFVQPKIKNHPRTARIFAYVYQDENTPYPADPRYMLAQAIKKAAQKNYTFYVGPEIEFFLVEQNNNGNINPWDHGYYCGVETEQKHELIKFEMMQTLLEHGIKLDKLHHEVAPGQHEIVLEYNNSLLIADHIMLAKHIIKQIAAQHGLIATFMPKPFFGMNGSGMHVHLSLADATTGWNLFFDEHNDAFLSSIAHQFLAGILHRVADGTLILNSCVNSFKRLVIGYEAPVYICWAKKNRSALFRIPQINADQPNTCRAEIRCADPMCNPYLTFCFLLLAGLAGIDNQEQIKPAIEENLFKLSVSEIQARQIQALPSSLNHALELFSSSAAMRELFDAIFVREYTKLKMNEALTFNRIITNWELEQYL